jgi:hypothetical protein
LEEFFPHGGMLWCLFLHISQDLVMQEMVWSATHFGRGFEDTTTKTAKLVMHIDQ